MNANKIRNPYALILGTNANPTPLPSNAIIKRKEKRVKEKYKRARPRVQADPHPAATPPLQNINSQSATRRIPNNLIAITLRDNFIRLGHLSWAIESQSGTIKNNCLSPPGNAEGTLKLVSERSLVEGCLLNVRIPNVEHLDLPGTAELGRVGECQFALIPCEALGEIKLDKGLGIVLVVGAGDDCFVGDTERGVGSVFLDVDNGAGGDHLSDMVAGDDAPRGGLCGSSGGDCSCKSSEDSESGGEDSRLHFDVWFGLVFGLGTWY